MADSVSLDLLVFTFVGFQDKVERLQQQIDQLLPLSDQLVDRLAEVERLQAENKRLQIDLKNLQNQMLIDGHSEHCSAVQGASVDCSCGARKL